MLVVMNPGESVDDDGEVLTCLRSSSAGGSCELELRLAPGKRGPPTHHHAEGPEIVEVTAGEILFVVAGEPRLLRAGDRLELAAGVPHTFRNPSKDTVAVARVAHGPRFERTLDQLAAGGPAFTRLAMYLSHVDREATYMVSPFVRGTLRIVALLGRLRGVRIIDACPPAASARTTSTSSSP